MANLIKHITATGATKVCSGPATLEKIVVNTAVTGAIAIFDLSAATGATGNIGTITPAGVPVELNYGIQMLNGIVISNAGATQDIIVAYRPGA